MNTIWQEFKTYTELDKKKLVKLAAFPFYWLGELSGRWFWKIAGEDLDTSEGKWFFVRAIFGGPFAVIGIINQGIENFILSFAKNDGEDEDG